MEQYDTLNDAITGLRKKGFTEDFNLKPFCLECRSLNIQLHPEEFEVKEHHRFEGMGDPGDNSVVYGIAGANGVKGILIDSYGVYSESLTPGMATRLGKEKYTN